MRQPDVTCPTCGAPWGATLVCRFCGNPREAGEDAATQLQMLRTLHHHIQSSDEKVQARLLSSGFVPRNVDVLVEAGMQCVPFLRDQDHYVVCAAAARRMEAILLRLRVDPASNSRTIAELERQMREFREADRRNLWLGILVAAAIVVCGWLVWRFH